MVMTALLSVLALVSGGSEIWTPPKILWPYVTQYGMAWYIVEEKASKTFQEESFAQRVPNTSIPLAIERKDGKKRVANLLQPIPRSLLIRGLSRSVFEIGPTGKMKSRLNNIHKILTVIIFLLNEFEAGASRVDCEFSGAEDALFGRIDVGGTQAAAEERPVADEDEASEVSLAAPQSSIGYEIPCGIRNSGRKSSGNKTLGMSGNRIVGGARAMPGEFPWQVSLQLLAGWVARHICGGAILSSYWVVTAGHCIADLKPSAVTVVAGDHDLFTEEGTEQRIKVVRIINAGYKTGDFTKDIAMLQLAAPLKMNLKRVAPICLPQMNKKYSAGESTLVAGWGKLSENGELPNILHYAELPVMSPNRCRKLYENAGYGRYMNKCQICGGYDQGGVDSCQGDSGGPLICRHEDKRYYLCGVVSFGVGCARPKLPGVYTEVACYSNWIKTILYNVNNYVSNLPAYDKNEN